MSPRRASLDALLRLRRHAELRAQVALATVERRRNALHSEANAAAQSIEAARAEIRVALAGPIEIAPLRLAAQGALVQERRRLSALGELAAGEPVRARAQRAVADASAARKGVELLHARREAERARGAARAEQASLDEIAARHAGGVA